MQSHFRNGLLQRVEHKRQIPGDDSIELLHCIRSLSRKPRAMLNWTHRHILFPSPAFTKFLKFLQKTSAETAEREFLASVNLVQHVPIHDIGLGMELICQVKSPPLTRTLRVFYSQIHTKRHHLRSHKSI